MKMRLMFSKLVSECADRIGVFSEQLQSVSMDLSRWASKAKSDPNKEKIDSLIRNLHQVNNSLFKLEDFLGLKRQPPETPGATRMLHPGEYELISIKTEKTK